MTKMSFVKPLCSRYSYWLVHREVKTYKGNINNITEENNTYLIFLIFCGVRIVTSKLLSNCIHTYETINEKCAQDEKWL